MTILQIKIFIFLLIYLIKIAIESHCVRFDAFSRQNSSLYLSMCELLKVVRTYELKLLL